MDTWSKLLDWLKQPPRIIAAITVAAGVIVFAPESLLIKLKIDAAFSAIGPYIGIVFLLGCSLLGTHLVAILFSSIRNRYLRMRFAGIRKKYLHELTADEKAILRYFIIHGTRTQRLPLECGQVAGLEARYIISRASTISRGGTDFDYNIQPWAWEYLHQNQHLLNEQGCPPR